MHKFEVRVLRREFLPQPEHSESEFPHIDIVEDHNAAVG